MTETSPADVRRWRRHLADELAEAAVYRDLADRVRGEDREILLALADAEGRHAAHWQELLGERAGRLPRPGMRMRLLAALARRFGSVFVLALAQNAETRSAYWADSDATAQMAADEQIHAEVVRALATRGRNQLAGSFRAAVFGANDGLVSNVALVIGVAAAGTSSSVILLTGLAGLLAGALSMAAGEFISVRSQRELLASTVPSAEAAAALRHLDSASNELTLLYRARGLSEADARVRAEEVLAEVRENGDRSPSFDADTAAPQDAHVVVGTDVGAALASFGFFAAGALIPVLPYLFGMTGNAALLVALAAVGAALLVTGGVVGVISGGPPGRRALRQLAIGFGAAAVTYGLGAAFGTTLA